ncbi:hypothetical protein M404DRAFT_999937 [Pisolithus tinctorius Marx 270]|uniref:Uncharacterized protein n=1 Tax=Pisolithus tinctorius Marx 270 TaxID=870435 RepID=A0A0C3J8I6_PISTI|nr:hypothetical protein M404DRAFT_999937 [Pisolithus tinctorius Marx 270]
MQQGKEAVGYVHHESGRPETTDEANYKEAGRVSSHSPSSSVLFHPQSHRSTPAFWGEGSIAQPEISLRLFVSFCFLPLPRASAAFPRLLRHTSTQVPPKSTMAPAGASSPKKT